MKYFDCNISPYINKKGYLVNLTKFIPYMRKKFSDFEIWEKGENGNELLCGVIYCEDCIIISTHGSEYGELLNYDKILDILTDPKFSNMEIKIHCCHPKKVAKRNPELENYLTLKYWSKVTGILCVREKGIAEFYKKIGNDQ